MSVRLPKRNKQNMKYSLQDGEQTIYRTDTDGNIQYQKVSDGIFVYPSGDTFPSDSTFPSQDAVLVPIKVGSRMTYSEPVELMASISFGNWESSVRDYGFSDTNFDATLMCMKSEYPLKVGSLIWYQNEVLYNSDGTVMESSADFRVIASRPSLAYDRFLLKAVQNG